MEKETKGKSKEEIKTDVKEVKETKKVEDKNTTKASKKETDKVVSKEKNAKKSDAKVKAEVKEKLDKDTKKAKETDKTKENKKESNKTTKKDKNTDKVEDKKNSKNDSKENTSIYNKRRIIYILVGVILILIAVLMYSNLITFGNNPKATVNNYFRLLKEDPQTALRKYGESEFEKKLKKERLKYLEYKVLSERKTNKKSESNINSTVYEVEIEIKNTSPRTVYEKTKKQMQNFKFKEGTKEYKKEFLKQYTKINKEESKKMKTIKNKIYVVKDTLSSKYILVDDIEK
ncbi:MAG: hypothetical protein ACTTGJ_02795 [Clostridium sp.]